MATKWHEVPERKAVRVYKPPRVIEYGALKTRTQAGSNNAFESGGDQGNPHDPKRRA